MVRDLSYGVMVRDLSYGVMVRDLSYGVMVRSTKGFIIYVGDTESRFYHIRLPPASDKSGYVKGHPFSPCYTI